ncbi:MAG TPA: hypothetical protein VNW29_02045 [Candidatus Sulfotelmatobacter sp.]|jgi:hypothetical protein|nr:hypothetical protein [Candidatus Sulfotelmatobacter sp.]
MSERRPLRRLRLWSATTGSERRAAARVVVIPTAQDRRRAEQGAPQPRRLSPAETTVQDYIAAQRRLNVLRTLQNRPNSRTRKAYAEQMGLTDRGWNETVAEVKNVQRDLAKIESKLTDLGVKKPVKPLNDGLRKHKEYAPRSVGAVSHRRTTGQYPEEDLADAAIALTEGVKVVVKATKNVLGDTTRAATRAGLRLTDAARKQITDKKSEREQASRDKANKQDKEPTQQGRGTHEPAPGRDDARPSTRPPEAPATDSPTESGGKVKDDRVDAGSKKQGPQEKEPGVGGVPSSGDIFTGRDSVQAQPGNQSAGQNSVPTTQELSTLSVLAKSLRNRPMTKKYPGSDDQKLPQPRHTDQPEPGDSK